MAQTHTTYLEYPLAKLMVPSTVNYDKILDRHGGGGGIPDPLHLQTMTEDLKTLAQLAEARSQVLDDGMREMAKRKKDFEREEKERLEKEQALRELTAKAEEQARLKKEAEDEENVRARAGAQLKKKNERNNVQEERPLTHGAHGLARQDGQVDMPPKGKHEGSPFRISTTSSRYSAHMLSSFQTILLSTMLEIFPAIPRTVTVKLHSKPWSVKPLANGGGKFRHH